MYELKKSLVTMGNYLLSAQEHLEWTEKELNDEIKKEAPDVCQAILEAEQRIVKAMAGIEEFINEIRSGKYPEKQSGGNKKFDPDQEN